MKSIFKDLFNLLNSSQKKAVNEIEGPVMVVAGPGTGKTQVLSMRVANILKKTQMRPSNILCLTFSNSGAKAMRERLREIIGPDAYGVTVSTVHSFCNDIIQQNPQLFVNFRALEQISNIARLRTVRKAIKELGLDSILYNPISEYDRASDVLDGITKMKREGILPEDLKKHIVSYKNEIKKTPTGRDRDFNSKSYLTDSKKVKQFEEFIEVYEKYSRELQESHRYDFDDMVLVVLVAFQEYEWLLRALQERYQYILVDEFQDLNGAQNSVLDLLTSYENKDLTPNIFVVGDDDQAIFRFQGANIGNMKSFVEKFAGAKIITLEESYRSTQNILNSASNVIKCNEDRLVRIIKGLKKDLVSANNKNGLKPQFIRYPDTDMQYSGIAEILRKSNKNNISWKEMAVICRRNEEALEMSYVLTAAGIPNVVAAKQDLMKHPQVLQAVTLLRAINEPMDSISLSGAMALAAFDCKPEDLGRLWMAFRTHNRENNKISFNEYILHTQSLSEDIKNAHKFIIQRNQKIVSTTLTELVADVLVSAKFVPSEDAKEADPRAIAGIHSFYEYVKNRCYEMKNLTLRNLLSDIDEYLSEPKLKLQYDLPYLVQDGVKIMTAHGAKGLEFDLVVIMNAWYRNWGNRSNTTSLSLPYNLIMNMDKEVEKRSGQEDERRLFYVAMTRARNQLYITFPETYRSNEQMSEAQVSTFVAEAGDSLDEKVIPQDQLCAPIETLILPTIKIDNAFKAFLLERLKDYELSVTALNVFLDGKDGPQKFLWEQLLQKPSEKKPNMAYGTAVHNALEERNLAWKEGNKYLTDELVASFLKHLKNEILTEEQQKKYELEGSNTIRKYGEKTSAGIPLILFAEKTFHAHLDEVPIKGKVDRIDLFEPGGRKCRILDYKTGKTYRTLDAVRKKDGLIRQLVFYKILCDSDPKFIHEADLFTFDFIGNKNELRQEIDIEISKEELKELKEIIKKVWTKIINLDFTVLD